MVSRAVLQVSFFIVTLCWAVILAPYLAEYYFTCIDSSDSLVDVFGMLFIIVLVIVGIPHLCYVLCDWGSMIDD
jgi:hypothetical protein